MYIVVIILLIIILYHFMNKEPYENYDEQTCLTLANKNQENLDSLKKDVDTLLALNDKVNQIQASTDSNTKQLSSLVDQVYKTPSV